MFSYFPALSGGLGERALHLNDGFFPEGGMLQTPGLLPRFLERFLQCQGALPVESTQEIAGGRGIRKSFGTEGIHACFVVALDLFQKASAAKHVAGDARRVSFEQHDVSLDGAIQPRFAYRLLQSSDPSPTKGAYSLGYGKVDIQIFGPGAGLSGRLFPFQPGFKTLPVSEVDFAVSFVHLKWAPFDRVSHMLIPITTNNEARSRLFAICL